MLEQYGDFLNTDEVGVVLHCEPWSVRDMCRKGVLPSIKVGRRILIPKEQLADYLEAKLAASSSNLPGGIAENAGG